jgi:hypothetical protein
LLVDRTGKIICLPESISTHRPETAGAFFCARASAGREETCLVTVIIEEMGRGNFSFLILIVGLLQLIVMLRKR